VDCDVKSRRPVLAQAQCFVEVFDETTVMFLSHRAVEAGGLHSLWLFRLAENHEPT
jgi:hypothetical protein